MGMTLFTKSLCSACQKIQKEFDLKALGIDVEALDNNPGALAQLAWHELVEVAEKSLPILIVGDKVLVDGEVEGYLKQLSDAKNLVKI